MKQLVSWLTNSAVFGAAEINAWCKALPPSHHITLFPNGITSLLRVSGKEHKAMCHFLLGLITDIPLSRRQVPSRMIRATCALLNFTSLAQFPSHMTATLCCLEEALKQFHNKKDVFLEVGMRNHFNLPKIHSLLHYACSIVLFGTTDKYNTEQMECLHIDLTKDVYRATNRKDEYFQMTTWVNCREKTQNHSLYIKWWQEDEASLQTPNPDNRLHCPRFLKMVQNPTIRTVSFDDLAVKYGTVDFQDCLVDFIVQVNNPGASAAVLGARAADTLLPFRSVSVFHQIKFSTSNTDNSKICDSVVARPEQLDTHGCMVPSRFDTVVVHDAHNSRTIIRRNNGEF